MVKLTSNVIWSGEGVRSVAHTGGHEVIIDEPTASGGTGFGPNPVQLLLSSLGGCMAVLIRSLAPHHHVTLKYLKIDVEGDLDPRGYREEDPSIRPGLQEIRYHVNIEADGEKEDIEALLTHAARVCPVKDTLKGVTVNRV